MRSIRCVVVSLERFPPEKSLKKFEAKFRKRLVERKLLDDLDNLTVTLCPGVSVVCIEPQLEGQGDAKLRQSIRLELLSAMGV